MNTKITALTLAAAFAFTPKPAVASDKGLTVVGGLIGGLIIASAINDHHTTVYIHDRPGSGYWNTVTYNVWIPGYWVTDHNPYGHTHRRYIPGRYECRNERVWVSTNRHGHTDRHHAGHDRYERSHDRNYNRHDRPDDRRDDRHNRDSDRDHRDNRR